MGLWFMALMQLVKKLFNVEAEKHSKLPPFMVFDGWWAVYMTCDFFTGLCSNLDLAFDSLIIA